MGHPLVQRREAFARLMAQAVGAGDAYIEAYGKDPLTFDRGEASRGASRLLTDTDVQLRIQELQRPVIRKLRRTIEYNLQHSLEDAQTAYDLALLKGNPNAMLAAIELRAKLGKFLTETVEHRHGLLDDASTATLLEMRKHIEKQKKAQITHINSTAVSVPTPPSEDHHA